LGIALLGTALEFSLKDRWVPTAIIYYATPWCLRGLMGAASCIIAWRDKALRWTGMGIVLCSSFQGVESLQFRKPGVPPASALRVSTWNVGHELHVRPDLWPAAAESDICAMVETGRFTEEEWRRFTSTAPQESWLRLDAGTAIGVKGSILDSEPIHEPLSPFRAFRVRLSLTGWDPFNVIVVDIHSQPWFSREPVMKAIYQAAAADRRCIILGDFNTPSQSRWLRPWRAAGLRLANDGPRNGFRETWPYGLPLWTLDQIWTGPNWEALATQHVRYGSDHAKVNVVLSAHE
jgi:hypothetical protein